MPFFVSVPLPGPFRYSARIGGRGGAKGGKGVSFWLLVGWWLYPMLWLVVGMWWLLKVTWLGCVALTRLALNLARRAQ